MLSSASIWNISARSLFALLSEYSVFSDLESNSLLDTSILP